MFGIVYASPPIDFDQIEDAFGSGYRFGYSGTRFADILNFGIVNIIFFVAGAAFLLYLVTGGLAMMTSKGDPKALEAAKGRITGGLTGFIIIFSAYWIVQIVGLLLGLNGFGGIFS